MTTINKNSDIKNESEAEVLSAMNTKTRAPRIYKLTVESFEQQIKTLEPKELFALQHALQVELDKRRTEAEALVAELKGGKA